MKRSSFLPVLGVLSLSAAAIGVQLGTSAIAEINPVHFQGPALHPRDRGAAIHEPLPPLAQPSYANLYGWAEGQQARTLECGDCGPGQRAERWQPAVVREERAPEPRYTPARFRPAEAEEAPAEAAPARYVIEYKEVERYASYPIESAGVEGEDSFASADY